MPPRTRLTGPAHRTGPGTSIPRRTSPGAWRWFGSLTALAALTLVISCQPLAVTTAGLSRERPIAFRERGRLACLAEEMQRLHQADVQPVHEHVLGFRLAEPGASSEEPSAGSTPAAAGRELDWVTILPTRQSRALFRDARFRDRDLELIGRCFPRSGLVEISGWRWFRDGKPLDVYYWCAVCSIRSLDPGACACCQGEVELRQVESRQVEPRQEEARIAPAETPR